MRHPIRSCPIIVALFVFHQVHGLTRWSNIDPTPVYSSMDPYEFLSVCGRSQLKNYCEDCRDKHARFTVSPFRQAASFGQPLEPLFTPAVPATATTTAMPANTDTQVELGNLKGPWNPIALFYDYCDTPNQEPCKNPRAFSTAGNLIDALDIFELEGTQSGDQQADYNRVCMSGPVQPISPAYPDTALNYPQLGQFNLVLDPAGLTTEVINKRFGYFSVPIEYRKYGVRFEAEFALCDFTFSVKAGIVHMRQMPKFDNFGCDATGRNCIVHDCKGNNPTGPCPNNPNSSAGCCPPPSPIVDSPNSVNDNCANNGCCLDWPDCRCKALVLDKIMKRPYTIAEVLGVDITTFDKTAAEDTEFDLNWSRMFSINEGETEWPRFVFTPFASAGFTAPTGNKTDPDPNLRRHLFALSSGNDGHWSYGGRFGCTFDFVETIAFGGEVGFTNFNTRQHTKYPLPTNRAQTGFFPFLGTVDIHPGLTWNFAVYVGAYHFLDRLSASAQYMGVAHDRDRFRNIVVTAPTPQPDPAEPVLTEKLEAESAWRVHVINAALNYDLSHSIRIGALWQIPVAQRNAYRASTVLGTVEITF